MGIGSEPRQSHHDSCSECLMDFTVAVERTEKAQEPTDPKTGLVWVS